MRILGIDPGFAITGYSIVDYIGNKLHLETSGAVLTEAKSGSTYFIYSVILAIIVLYNHRSNIKRILSGTENKISLKK